MNEEVELVLETTKESMEGSLSHLEKAFANIRAGKASPMMVRSVMVSYYGTPTPLNQVANVSAPDARTLMIQPWERNIITEIERGIMLANLGFNPMNNGEAVIINIPPLTEERRRELVKQAKGEAEEARVSIRNARRDANSEIKKMDISEDLKKNVEIDVQQLTDKYTAKVEEHLAIKEKEIMTV